MLTLILTAASLAVIALTVRSISRAMDQEDAALAKRIAKVRGSK